MSTSFGRENNPSFFGVSRAYSSKERRVGGSGDDVLMRFVLIFQVCVVTIRKDTNINTDFSGSIILTTARPDVEGYPQNSPHHQGRGKANCWCGHDSLVQTSTTRCSSWKALSEECLILGLFGLKTRSLVQNIYTSNINNYVRHKWSWNLFQNYVRSKLCSI